MRLDPAIQGYPYSSATARAFLILTHLALLPSMRLAWSIRNSAPWLLFGLLGCFVASSMYHACYSFDACFFVNYRIHRHADHFLSTMLAPDIFTTFLWYRLRRPDDITGDPPPSRLPRWPHRPPPQDVETAGQKTEDELKESTWAYCKRRVCCCCCCGSGSGGSGSGCWSWISRCSLVAFYVGVPPKGSERTRAAAASVEDSDARFGTRTESKKKQKSRGKPYSGPPLLLTQSAVVSRGDAAATTAATVVAAQRLGYYRPLYINVVMAALHILNIYFHLHLGWNRYADYMIFGVAATIALVSHITEILATGLRVRMVVLAAVLVPTIIAYMVFYMDDYFGAIGHNVWHLLIFLAFFVYVRWGPIFVPADGMYVSLER